MTLVSAGNAACTIIFLLFLAVILASFKHLRFSSRQKILAASQRILLSIQNLHQSQGIQRAVWNQHEEDDRGENIQDTTQNQKNLTISQEKTQEKDSGYLDVSRKTMIRLMFQRYSRRFNSVVSIIEYIHVKRQYIKLEIFKGQELHCSNEKLDVWLSSHFLSFIVSCIWFGILNLFFFSVTQNQLLSIVLSLLIGPMSSSISIQFIISKQMKFVDQLRNLESNWLQLYESMKQQRNHEVDQEQQSHQIEKDHNESHEQKDLSRDISKSSGIQTILAGAENSDDHQNSRVIQIEPQLEPPITASSVDADQDDALKISHEGINDQFKKINQQLLLCTVLLASISAFIIFNLSGSALGSSLIVCWVVCILGDIFVVRFLIIFLVALINTKRYYYPKNVPFRSEINSAFSFELAGLETLLVAQLAYKKKEQERKEQSLKVEQQEKQNQDMNSPASRQRAQSLKQPEQPYQTESKITNTLKKIKDSIKKLTSPGKKRYQQVSPNQIADEEIQRIEYERKNKIQVVRQIFNDDSKTDNLQEHDSSTNNDCSVNLFPLSHNRMPAVSQFSTRLQNDQNLPRKDGQQSMKKKDNIFLDSNKDQGLKINSDRQPNSMRLDQSQIEDNLDDSNWQNTRQNKPSSIPGSCMSQHGVTDMQSSSFCVGRRKSNRNKEFNTSQEFQSRDFQSRNRIIFENAASRNNNDGNQEPENCDSSIQPFKKDHEFNENLECNDRDEDIIHGNPGLTQNRNNKSDNRAGIIIEAPKEPFLSESILAEMQDKSKMRDSQIGAALRGNGSQIIQQQLALKRKKIQEEQERQLVQKPNEEQDSQKEQQGQTEIRRIENNQQNYQDYLEEKKEIEMNEEQQENPVENRQIETPIINEEIIEQTNKPEEIPQRGLTPQLSINPLTTTPSASFLHPNNNDVHMLTIQQQQQQKDLSIFFQEAMESEEDAMHGQNNDNNILSPNTKIDKKKTLSPIAPTDQKQIDISDDDIEEHPRPEPSHLAFNSSQYRQPLSQQSVQNQQGQFFNTQRQSQQEQKREQQLSRKDDTQGWNTSRNSLGIGNNKENFDSKTLGVFQKERQRNQDIKTISNTAGVRDSLGSNSNRQRSSAYSINRRKSSDKTIDQSNLPYLEPLPQIMKYPKDEKKKIGSRRNSQDLGDKIKGVIDIYGFELGRKDSRNIIIPKSNSARSSRSQESKRSRDNDDNQLPKLKDLDDNIIHNEHTLNTEQHQNHHILKNQYRHNDSSLSQRSRASVLSIGESVLSQKMHPNESQGDIQTNNQHRKLYPHQAASVVAKQRPPLSRTLLSKDYSSSNHLNSCRASSIRQQSIDTPDLSTVTINNATPTSNATNGQTIQFEQERGQEFILIRSNNAEAIQIEIANSDRQDDRSGIAGDDFDFEAHFQNLKYPDNTFSSFDHSHFAQQKD